MSKIQEKVDHCIKVLQSSKSTKERKAAVKELCTLGMNAEAALPELMKIINNGREDFSVQSIAEEAVVIVGEPAIPLLKKLLKSVLRKKRLKGLGLLGDIALSDRQVIDTILLLIKPIARHDINYQVRLDAVLVIKKIVTKYKNHQKGIELLGEILRRERNFLVRREASEALAAADGKLAIMEIVKSMERKNYPFLRFSGETRVEAANALFAISTDNPKKIKETIPFLFTILKSDPYPSVRISVLIPLIMSGGWNVLEEVLDIIIKDRWGQVRMSALDTAKLLVYQKPPKDKVTDILPIIKKIAREDKDEPVKDSARRLIEEIEELLKEEG